MKITVEIASFKFSQRIWNSIYKSFIKIFKSLISIILFQLFELLISNVYYSLYFRIYPKFFSNLTSLFVSFFDGAWVSTNASRIDKNLLNSYHLEMCDQDFQNNSGDSLQYRRFPLDNACVYSMIQFSMIILYTWQLRIEANYLLYVSKCLHSCSHY